MWSIKSRGLLFLAWFATRLTAPCLMLAHRWVWVYQECRVFLYHFVPWEGVSSIQAWVEHLLVVNSESFHSEIACLQMYIQWSHKHTYWTLLCVFVMSGWSPPAEMVGRQRSSSDPSNPQSPDKNISVYGESNLSTVLHPFLYRWLFLLYILQNSYILQGCIYLITKCLLSM